MPVWAELIASGLTARQVRALERMRHAHARGVRWDEFDRFHGSDGPWYCRLEDVRRCGPPNYPVRGDDP